MKSGKAGIPSDKRRTEKHLKLTISVQPIYRPVIIGCADYAVCRRDKEKFDRLRYIVENFEYEDIRETFSPEELGPSSFYMVLGESDLYGDFMWHGVRVIAMLDGRPVFNQIVSPDNPHGVKFESTESPLGIEFGNGTDEWLVATVRWRGIRWTPRILDVPPTFHFDPAKLVIPYFRFAIDYDGAERTMLIRDDAIRYDGKSPNQTADYPLIFSSASEPRDISFPVLARDGLRPCPELMFGWDWAQLLETQPQYANQCHSWKMFSGYAWSSLLSRQPGFANRCNWVKFTVWNCVSLLIARPEFADKCDWAKLTDLNLSSLCEIWPDFAIKQGVKTPVIP